MIYCKLARRAAAMLASVLVCAAALCGAQNSPKTLKGLDPQLMDHSVDPCANFYQYSCGGWLKQNPIPSDQAAYGRDTELAEENRLVLKAILDKAAAGGAERSPNEQKIGDAYATCMDTAAIDKAGLAALDPVLKDVDALTAKEQLPELLGRLHRSGISALFRFGSEQDYKDATQQIAAFDQARLGLPEKGYYSRTDEKSVKLRQQFVDHVTRMFVLLGEPATQAATDAQTVLKLETTLATASLSNVERRDPSNLYHKTQFAAFATATPQFGVATYLRAMGAPQVDALNVATPQFFAAFNTLLAGADIAELKTYLRWSEIHGIPATALPKPVDDESFSFYGKTLNGQPEQQVRWKRCVRAVDGALGEALGQVYVAQRFSAADKQRTQELTRDVEDAMARDVDSLDWMSPATKTKAKEKLHAVANKIGYPDKWRDYSTLTVVRGDALGNATQAATFERKRQIAKIGQPVDRGEWDMSPPTVNAYYNPQMNDINFPAGILQPPYFDGTMDDAVNYGDAGGVIGHELTHGFDDEGRQFDANGNFADWWTPADGKQFTERSNCVVKEFDGFVAVDDLHVNGKLTLGENLADIGGLRLAFLAYLDRAQKTGVDLAKQTEGMTPEQRFFVSYGQGWCTNNRPENLRLRVQTDPHSPEEFRVNGVVVNLPEFQKAFACKTGSAMAPAERCRVW
jgi:putative endopeptidase